MKKIIALAVLALGITQMNAQSFEASLGTFRLLSAAPKVELMYHIDDYNSGNLELRRINLPLSYIFTSDPAGQVNAEARFTGFVFSPEFIRYTNPGRFDNSGFYYGLFLRAKSMQTSNLTINEFGSTDDYDFTQKALGLGINLGRHKVFDNGLTYRIYASLGYNLVNNINLIDGNASYFSDTFSSGLFGRTGVMVGYRF